MSPSGKHYYHSRCCWGQSMGKPSYVFQSVGLERAVCQQGGIPWVHAWQLLMISWGWRTEAAMQTGQNLHRNLSHACNHQIQCQSTILGRASWENSLNLPSCMDISLVRPVGSKKVMVQQQPCTLKLQTMSGIAYGSQQSC